MNFEQFERQRLEPPESDKEIPELDVNIELANMAINQRWVDSAEAYSIDENTAICELAKTSLSEAIKDNSPINNMMLGTFFKKVYMMHFEQVAKDNIQEERAKS